VTFVPSLANIPNIIWDFNDGNTMASGGGTVTHTYTTPGTYVPKIIMTDGSGCSSASLGKDTIKVDGVTPDFYHSPACVGSMVKFTDTSKGFFTPVVSWAWTFHTGQPGTSKTPTHYYPTAGTYPVKLIATNANGCKDTLIRDITVNELPNISAGDDTVICLKDAAQLQGTGGVSYLWSPATNLSCTNCANPLASPTDTTVYTVIGTDANQCSDTDRVIVGLKYKVDSKVGDGDEICLDESITLSVSGGRIYEWSPSSVLDNGGAATPVAKPRNNTKFMVIAREGSCIPDTNYVEVIVHPKPTVHATGGATIIAGNDAPLNASGDLIKKFSWSPAGTLDCPDCPNPIAKPIRTTDYTITGITEFGCQDSDKVTIIVLCDQSQLFIPNTFTPNGDGQNDMFYPRGVGFDNLRSFRIFNRWGEIVYEKKGFALNDKATGWDGTFKGRELPPDVFMYMVEADCDNGDIIQWKGDVTLIR
jgi:gliding motility-associated-like protein